MNISSNQSELSSMDLQLENRILAFRDEINFIRENPNLKSGGGPWDVEDAIYSIETLANYTYGDASYSLEGFTIDSSFFVVPLTDGHIPSANMPGIFDQVIDSLRSHNDRISSTEKQLIAVDISLTGIAGVGATFKVASGFGIESDLPGGNYYPWYWGWELGRCDGSGLGVGYDAADKIYQLANLEANHPGGNSYYDTLSTSYAFADGCQYEYNNECALFEDFQQETLIHKCLSTTDISFYKNGLIYIGDLLKPSGKTVCSYFLEDYTAYELCGGVNCWLMVHHATIMYGIWHTSSNPPEDL